MYCPVSSTPHAVRSPSAARSLAALALAVSALLVGPGCSETESTPLGSSTDDLTAAQCSYFAVGDTVQVCHRTSSARNPYVIVRTNRASCGGHSLHAGDYITSSDPSSPIYDPTCNGRGCLPAGAPADPSIECCEGLTTVGGVCTPTDPCAPTLVDDDDACTADACNPATGAITHTPVSVDDGDTCTVDACDPAGGVSHALAADGTACDDGNPTTSGEVCTAGVCAVPAVSDCAGHAVDTTGLVRFAFAGVDGAGTHVDGWYAFTPTPAVITYPEFPSDRDYWFPDASTPFVAHLTVTPAAGPARCFDSLPVGLDQSANIYVIDHPAGLGDDAYALEEVVFAEAGTGFRAGFVFVLQDMSGQAMTSTALPLTPPALAGFAERRLVMTDYATMTSFFEGTLTALTQP